MDPRIHLFGIRHHGPGSAASLLRALEAVDPAAVLVEAPADAQAALAFAALDGMRPPLALLLHAADDPACARFQPFAEFSPEWQAIRFAIARGRPVRAIDLPFGRDLHRAPDAAAAAGPIAVEASPARFDPLDLLAQLTGHSDGEAWWNAMVEQAVAPPALFDAIGDAMAALREGIDPGIDAVREARREAFMRLEIARAAAEIPGALAVVVGAWHVPALRAPVKASADRALLKGERAGRIEVTWVPWTDDRLASASGYAAGVISPGWYRHLWHGFAGGRPGDALAVAAAWQTRVATLLRAEGLAAATASAIEAARLALALAALRGHPLPGLAEMQDASLAALCHGDALPLRVVERRLVIGDAIGEIDARVPQMPLAADLAREQRRLRLKPEATEKDHALDLRSDAGLHKSILLHRLVMLDVAWGRLIEASAGRGTFREIWRLAWQPELSVKLAIALRFGTTLAQAAGNAAVHRARGSERIAELAELVRGCLLADLAHAASEVIARLQAVSVASSDVAALMAAAVPLVDILRYGTARRLPEAELRQLVHGLATEVGAGLRYACHSLDAAAADAMVARAAAFDRAIGLLDADDLTDGWLRALHALAADDRAAARLVGFAVRCLHDRQALGSADTAAALSRALSAALPPQHAAGWLLGFLGDAAQVLLHDPTLLCAIDAWLQQQEAAVFLELLPVLRRAFADFDANERRQLLARLMRGDGGVESRGIVATPDHAALCRVLPLVLEILGVADE